MPKGMFVKVSGGLRKKQHINKTAGKNKKTKPTINKNKM